MLGPLLSIESYWGPGVKPRKTNINNPFIWRTSSRVFFYRFVFTNKQYFFPTLISRQWWSHLTEWMKQQHFTYSSACSILWRLNVWFQLGSCKRPFYSPILCFPLKGLFFILKEYNSLNFLTCRVVWYLQIPTINYIS